MDPPLEQIQKLQLLLLKHDIHLFPQGFENSQEKIEELIQILKEDEEFNDNLQTEINKFLSIDPQQFKQILDYDTHMGVYKEYDNKLLEYKKFQEKVKEVQNKITQAQKDIPNSQAYIHNYLIRDQDRVQLLEEQKVYVQLNQIKDQAIQEIYNLDKRHIAEVKAFSNPPQAVQRVAEIIVSLCNNTTNQNNSWTQFKRLLANPSEFTTKLNYKFKIEDVSTNPLRIARQVFEGLNADQCNRCSQCAHTLYKWSQYQFQIIDILNTYRAGVKELLKHKKAKKLQENLLENKERVITLSQNVEELSANKQPQILDKEDKAIKVIATVKWFDELQIIIKPQQYGIKITNYLIKFLQQQQCPNNEIDSLIEEVMTKINPNYTILFDETPQEPYKFPLILNQLINENDNLNKLAKETILKVRNPIQFYNNVKDLNCFKDWATVTKIHSLVYQIYFNVQRYSVELLSETLGLIYQAINLLPNQIQFTVHPILRILHVGAEIERKAVLGIIKHIKGKSKINIQHQPQLKFREMPLMDYLINSYLEDNQNKNKIKFNEQQLEAIKELIIKEKLEIDETIENIIQNYEIISKSKEYYNEVNKGIENIKFKIQENKDQIVNLKNQVIQYNDFQNKLRVPYNDLLKEKKCLEDQLKVLKDKDLIIKEKIDKQKKSLNRPIHHGIKINELGFFKGLSKFDPITYFASKITLIQLGIYSFTPDMIKQIGSQTSVKKLTKLTVNTLTIDQYDYLQKLLLEFNQNNTLQRAHNKAIQNLIRRPYRIFQLAQLLYNNNQTFVQRTDLLQKQRVIKNKLSIINQMKLDLDQQVLSGLEDRIKQIRKEIELREDEDNQTTANVDQFNDLQKLEGLIKEIEQFDTINLCIQLIYQNFTSNQSEVQITKQLQQQLQILTQIQFQQIPKGLQKQLDKYNLLFKYLQEQYRNNQVELKSIYDNKGLFNQFKQPLVVDALTYWSYYNKTAKTNINILIGIYSYQLFYYDFGHQVQAICVQPEHYLIDHQTNINYQIRVLYEILDTKYGSLTLSVILQFLKQVKNVQSKIGSIYDILDYQINIEAQNEIEFKEFQQEAEGMLNCQIKEFLGQHQRNYLDRSSQSKYILMKIKI
ncbi:hypothetical protein pb186bvf_002233 [Paramecium bursaria]